MVSLLIDGPLVAPPAMETAAVGAVTVPWVISDYASEYRALRHGCGLLDHSAGGPVRVTGADAVEVLQAALARDVEFLPPERAMTSLLLDHDGALVDVVTVLASEQDFLVLTGPGSAALVADRLAVLASSFGDAQVSDESDRFAVFAIEGPTSWRALAQVAGRDYATLGYENSLPITVDGVDALIARLGVTGEYGYTFVAPLEAAISLWEAFVAAGAVPTGHRARETAMLEVRQPILHREANPSDTVLTSGLNWLVELSKEEFVGRDALRRAIETAGPNDMRPIGFTVTSGTVAPDDELFVGEESVGTVTMVVDSLALGAQLGLAKVPAEWQASRLDFTGAGGATLSTLAPPYVVPASWSVAIKI